MDFWTASVVIVAIVFGSVFGPSIIQELRRGFGLGNQARDGNFELLQELRKVRQEMAEMREAYNDKILELEKEVRNLKAAMPGPSYGAPPDLKLLAERGEGPPSEPSEHLRKAEGSRGG